MEAQVACQPDCLCGEPSNWKAEELALHRLQDVIILDMKGADYEVTFLKQLFNCATALKTMRVTFDYYYINESRAREVRQMLSSSSRPETLVELYMYHSASKESRYMLAPDQDHGV